jgi:hypothetical protein
MARPEHIPHIASADRLRVREAHDRSWAAWQMAVRRVDTAAEAVIRPVRVRASADPERRSPLPGIQTRDKVQRELFDD